ncbi:MAG: hypothetical protein ACPG36_10665, partial [Candidatus Puniceispirillaceae bacterium]
MINAGVRRFIIPAAWLWVMRHKETGDMNMFMKKAALTSGIAAAFMLASAGGASAFTACQVTDVGGIDDSGFNETAWKG